MKKWRLVLLGAIATLVIPIGAMSAVGVGPAGATSPNKMTAVFTFKYTHGTAGMGKATCNAQQSVSFNSSTFNTPTVAYATCATTQTGAGLRTTSMSMPPASMGRMKFTAAALHVETVSGALKITLARNDATFTVTRTSQSCAVKIKNETLLMASSNSNQTFSTGTKTANTHMTVSTNTLSFCKAVTKTLNHANSTFTMTLTFHTGGL